MQPPVISDPAVGKSLAKQLQVYRRSWFTIEEGHVQPVEEPHWEDAISYQLLSDHPLRRTLWTGARFVDPATGETFDVPAVVNADCPPFFVDGFLSAGSQQILFYPLDAPCLALPYTLRLEWLKKQLDVGGWRVPIPVPSPPRGADDKNRLVNRGPHDRLVVFDGRGYYKWGVQARVWIYGASQLHHNVSDFTQYSSVGGNKGSPPVPADFSYDVLLLPEDTISRSGALRDVVILAAHRREDATVKQETPTGAGGPGGLDAVDEEEEKEEDEEYEREWEEECELNKANPLFRTSTFNARQFSLDIVSRTKRDGNVTILRHDKTRYGVSTSEISALLGVIAKRASPWCFRHLDDLQQDMTAPPLRSYRLYIAVTIPGNMEEQRLRWGIVDQWCNEPKWAEELGRWAWMTNWGQDEHRSTWVGVCDHSGEKTRGDRYFPSPEVVLEFLRSPRRATQPWLSYLDKSYYSGERGGITLSLRPIGFSTRHRDVREAGPLLLDWATRLALKSDPAYRFRPLSVWGGAGGLEDMLPLQPTLRISPFLVFAPKPGPEGGRRYLIPYEKIQRTPPLLPPRPVSPPPTLAPPPPSRPMSPISYPTLLPPTSNAEQTITYPTISRPLSPTLLPPTSDVDQSITYPTISPLPPPSPPSLPALTELLLSVALC